MDYFTLFEIPISYDVDIDQLTSRFQQLQRQFHPDRFVSQSESERLFALQQASIINQAYQTLRHPLKRAEYLLSINGIDINNEQQTLKDTPFLMTQLSLRETLEEIENARDKKALHVFKQKTQKMAEDLERNIEEQLMTKHWIQAADSLRKQRFIEKLNEKIEALEEDWL